MANRADGITLRKPKVSYSPNMENDITVEMRTLRNDGRVIHAPLYPHAIEISHRRNSHWFTTEFNSHLQIIYVSEGRLRYRCDNRSFLIGGSRILIIPPGKAFHFETVAAGRGPGYRKTVLFINGVNLPGILETLALEKCAAVELPESTAIERCFKTIYDLLGTPDEAHFPALAAACFELLHYLSGFVDKPNNASPLLFNLIKNQMQSNFAGEGAEVAALAQKFNVSDRTIRRMFRANLGITPARYRRQCRHHAACELLAMTELSIKEIADRLGYSSQFHFSREFRRETGLPPRNWRRERRKTDL